MISLITHAHVPFARWIKSHFLICWRRLFRRNVGTHFFKDWGDRKNQRYTVDPKARNAGDVIICLNTQFIQLEPSLCLSIITHYIVVVLCIDICKFFIFLLGNFIFSCIFSSLFTVTMITLSLLLLASFYFIINVIIFIIFTTSSYGKPFLS